MKFTDRFTGKQYILIKRWNTAGRFMQASDLRRYDLIKRYI